MKKELGILSVSNAAYVTSHPVRFEDIAEDQRVPSVILDNFKRAEKKGIITAVSVEAGMAANMEDIILKTKNGSTLFMHDKNLKEISDVAFKPCIDNFQMEQFARLWAVQGRMDVVDVCFQNAKKSNELRNNRKEVEQSQNQR